MGKRIFPEGITTDQSNLSSIDTGLLQRVDTGVLEAAQTGVEYFSPDQHGGIHGKIVRRYFSGTTAASSIDTTVLSSCGYSKIINFGGYVDAGSSPLAIGGYLSSDGFGALQVSSGDLKLANGTSYYGKPYELWVDVILTTPPTTSPTGQPFADPSSNLMKRSDTGAYELTQVDVEYYSPEQHGGIFGTVYRKYISGTVDGGEDQLVLTDTNSEKDHLANIHLEINNA